MVHSCHRATPLPRARRRPPNTSTDMGMLNTLIQGIVAALQPLTQCTPPSHVPSSAALDKCELEMSVSANTQTCGNCNRHHTPEKEACATRNIACNYCKKIGSFEKACRGKAGVQISAALMMAATGGIPSPTAPPMPTIEVTIGQTRSSKAFC